MNFSQLAKNQGLDEEEFLQLVELFVETSASSLDILRSAIDREDTQQVVEAAHSIKGAAGNLGLDEIYEMTKTVEEKALKNSLEGAAEAVRSIEEKCNLIGEVLRK